MSIRFLHITGTIIALGAISTVTSAILYFMRLPIFSETGLAWAFVIGLMSAALAASALAVRSIWENQA